jgi:hypothetical protein
MDIIISFIIPFAVCAYFAAAAPSPFRNKDFLCCILDQEV